MPKNVTPTLEEKLEDLEMTFDELAVAIEKVSNAAKALFKSRLKEKTLLVLISRSSGVSQREVKAVLDCLPELERDFLKNNK